MRDLHSIVWSLGDDGSMPELLIVDGNPDGVLEAENASLAINPATGAFYIKTSSDSTSWVAVSGGSGVVETIVEGTGISVDDTDAANPIIALSAGAIASLASADTAVQPSRSISAGTGLTGGGDLSADRSIALSAASITSLGLADTAVQPTRSLTAGSGLTGGGDLSADRTFTVGAGTGITVNADDVAINQAFTPTWSGAHTFTNATPITISVATPRLLFNATGGGTDGKLYDINVTATNFAWRTRTDADGAGVNIISVTRTASSTAITDISVGNATNNPTFQFLGTGTVTVNGGLTIASNLMTLSGSSPTFRWSETDRGTDLKGWAAFIEAGVWTFSTLTDANAAGRNWLAVTRGSTIAISNISFGNATDNPSYNFLGTGTVQFSAGVAMGRWSVTSSTVPGNGAYLPGTNRLGFSTNTTYRGEFNASGQFIIATVGAGLSVPEGSNAKMGTATLVGGTVTVNTTAVTANSRIFLQHSTTGGTVGVLTYTISAATSFTVTSSSGTDTSTFNWLLVEPS